MKKITKVSQSKPGSLAPPEDQEQAPLIAKKKPATKAESAPATAPVAAKKEAAPPSAAPVAATPPPTAPQTDPELSLPPGSSVKVSAPASEAPAAPAAAAPSPKKEGNEWLTAIAVIVGIILGMLAVCWFSMRSPWPKSPDYGSMLINPGRLPVKDGGTNPPAGTFKAYPSPMEKTVPTDIIDVSSGPVVQRRWTNTGSTGPEVGSQWISVTVTGDSNVFNAPLVVNGTNSQTTDNASPAVKTVRPPRPPKPAKVAPQPAPTVTVTNTVTVTVTNLPVIVCEPAPPPPPQVVVYAPTPPPPPPVIVEPYGFNGFRGHLRVLVRPLSPPIEVAPYGYPPIQY